MAKQLKHLGLAYLFIHISFYILSIDLLPSFVAYYMFLKALPTLSKHQKSLQLLENLLHYLLAYSVIIWMFDIIHFNIPFSTFLRPLMTIISLYFHFQFLTDIYTIASNYEWPKASSFLQIRSIEVIVTTILHLFPSIISTQGWTILFMIALLLHLAWTYATFYDFSSYLEKKDL